MKKTIFIALALVSVSCSVTRPILLSRKDYARAQVALAKDIDRITGSITNQPPLTMDSKFVSACPYCGQINLSKWCGASGGRTVNSGEAILIPLPGGGHTNVIVNSSGNLETWSITYKCIKCDMAYSDYRYQMSKPVHSLRLPVLGDEIGVGRNTP